jgi:hypothetical protein
MNPTTKKTMWIAAAVVIVLVLIFSFSGWNLGNKVTVVDNQYGDMMGNNNGAGSTSPAGANGNTSGAAMTGSASGGTKAQTGSIPSDASLMSLISVANLRVPTTGVDVTLAGGAANYTEGSAKGRVSVDRILAKVPTDSGYDVFTDMTMIQDGKSSVIHYVALFRSVGQGIQFTSAVSIGDRVGLVSVTAAANASASVTSPKSYMVSANGYNATLSYLDRKNGEAVTASPSVMKTKVIFVKDHLINR